MLFLSALWDQLKAWAQGYSKETIKLSFQIFIAYVVVIGIIAPEKVWTALSYGPLIPAFSLVFLVLVAPDSAGSAALGAVYLVSGFLLGGGFAAIATYIAYAANGGSFDSSAIKGVVFTLFISVFAAMFNSLRWWWDATNQLFYLSAIGLIISGGLSTYWLPYIAWEAVFYIVALAAIAGATATLSCWLIFPVTAGSKYRKLVSQALLRNADALEAIEKLMLGPLDPATGHLQAVKGALDPFSGVDLGLASNYGDVRAGLKAARGCLVASSALHLPVLMELAVYEPNQKFFPRKAFMHVKLTVNMLISATDGLARPLTSGSINLSFVQREAMQSCFQKVTTAMQHLMRSMAAAIVATKPGGYEAADCDMEALDASWMDLLDTALVEMKSCQDDDEAFGVRGLASFLYLAGTRMRAVYAALP